MGMTIPPFSDDLSLYNESTFSSEDEESDSENDFDFPVVDNFEKETCFNFERLKTLRMASISIENKLVDVYLKNKSKINTKYMPENANSKNETFFNCNYAEKIVAQGHLHYLILTLFPDGYTIHCNGPDFGGEILCGVSQYTNDDQFNIIMDDIDKGELPFAVYEKIIIHERFCHYFFHNFYVILQTFMYTSRKDNEPLFSRFDFLKSSSEVWSAMLNEFDRNFDADLYPDLTDKDKSYITLMEETNLLQFGPIFTDPNEFDAADFSGLLGVRRKSNKSLIKSEYLSELESKVEYDESFDLSESDLEIELPKCKEHDMEEEFQKILALREMEYDDMIMCKTLDMFLVEAFYFFRMKDGGNLSEKYGKLRYKLYVFWKDELFYIYLSAEGGFNFPGKNELRYIGTRVALDKYILQTFEWVSEIFFNILICRTNKFECKNNEIVFGPRRKFFSNTCETVQYMKLIHLDSYQVKNSEEIYENIHEPETSSDELSVKSSDSASSLDLSDVDSEKNGVIAKRPLSASETSSSQSSVKRLCSSDTNSEDSEISMKSLSASETSSSQSSVKRLCSSDTDSEDSEISMKSLSASQTSSSESSVETLCSSDTDSGDSEISMKSLSASQSSSSQSSDTDLEDSEISKKSKITNEISSSSTSSNVELSLKRADKISDLSDAESEKSTVIFKSSLNASQTSSNQSSVKRSYPSDTDSEDSVIAKKSKITDEISSSSKSSDVELSIKRADKISDLSDAESEKSTVIFKNLLNASQTSSNQSSVKRSYPSDTDSEDSVIAKKSKITDSISSSSKSTEVELSLKRADKIPDLSDEESEKSTENFKNLTYVDEFAYLHKVLHTAVSCVISEAETSFGSSDIMGSKATKVLPKRPVFSALDRSDLFRLRCAMRLTNVSKETLKCISLNDYCPKRPLSANLLAAFDDSDDSDTSTKYPDIPGRVYIQTVVEDDTTISIFEANDFEINDSTLVFTFPKHRRDITKVIRVFPSARHKSSVQVPAKNYDHEVSTENIKRLLEMIGGSDARA